MKKLLYPTLTAHPFDRPTGAGIPLLNDAILHADDISVLLDNLNLESTNAFIQDLNYYFRMCYNFSAPLAGGIVGYYNSIPHAILGYMLIHSQSIAELAEPLKGRLTKIATGLGHDVEDSYVYWGNRADFEKYFFESDFIAGKTKPHFQTNADFFKSPAFGLTYGQVTLDDLLYEIALTDPDTDKSYCTVATSLGFEEYDRIDFDIIEPIFKDYNLVDHAWDFLRFTHTIIELGDICLIFDTSFNPLSSLNEYIELLEFMEPSDELAPQLEQERQTYYSCLRLIEEGLVNYVSKVKRLAQNYFASRAVKTINEKQNQIDKAGTNTQVVVNDYTW